MTRDRIAVLGGGMLGVCTALGLARRGRRVTLIEGAYDLMQGASRWNEGKIHLGFLYAADPTLNTATRLIPGGLAFTGLVEELIEQGIGQFATTDDDLFFVHRNSVVDRRAFGAYALRAAACVRDAATARSARRYLADVSSATVRELSPSEVAMYSCAPEIVAGFAVPERSVSTVPIADLLCRAVRSDSRIELRLNAWVQGVQRRRDGRLDVLTDVQNTVGSEPFDVVVNALWEGRPAVDATMGIAPPAAVSHRFRAAMFGQVADSELRSAVICTGPFGDIKRYADGRVYLSWYEAGLIAEGDAIEPPRASAVLTDVGRDRVARGTLAELSRFFPSVVPLRDQQQTLEVRGGWVFAIGGGSLADPASTLHQRDKFNLTTSDGYISVDTAKYSLAPWLAHRVVQMIDKA